MRIHTIIPGKLYQCAEFIKVPLNTKLAALNEYGIDSIVNLYSHSDRELEMEMYEYIFCPMPDGVTFDPMEVMEVVYRAVDLIKMGHVVLTHCHAGRNRSGFVNALIVKDLWKCSGEEALRVVRAGRPRSVATPIFEEFVREYDHQY